MVDRTAELEKTRTRVMREHQCDCEVCSRSAALCPASAGTLIDELACHVMATAELRDRVAELEREVLLLREGKALAMRERDEAREQRDQWKANVATVGHVMDEGRAQSTDRIRALEAARDRLDCSVREGAGVYHCPVDANCEACTARYRISALEAALRAGMRLLERCVSDPWCNERRDQARAWMRSDAARALVGHTDE